jgi:hypothetical protein
VLYVLKTARTSSEIASWLSVLSLSDRLTVTSQARRGDTPLPIKRAA